MKPPIVIVQAIPGREQLTAATVRQLHAYGGAAKLAIALPCVLHWTAPDPPPFELPPGWALIHETLRDGHRRDLWRILREVVGRDRDVALFEDDVTPCRNAVEFIARWPLDVFTTFHNMMRLSGLQPIDRQRFFWGIQAVRIPSRLVGRFIEAGDTDSRPQLRAEGGDTRLGRLLMSWGEKIYHHRSLVQHVGAKSVGNPGARLVGIRAPADDFDPDLDAMTLQIPKLAAAELAAAPLCEWPGIPGCQLAALPGTPRCDVHTVRRRRWRGGRARLWRGRR